MRSTTHDDQRAIIEVYARYSLCFDTGDADGCAQLFTEDGAFEAPQRPATVGRDALTAFFRVAVERSSGIAHFVSNILVEEVSATQAKGSATVLAVQIVGDRVHLAALGRYRDRFVKSGGAWLLHERRVDSMLPTSLAGAVVASPG
jgi:hypothetical protein